jgi:hypothetical protein
MPRGWAQSERAKKPDIPTDDEIAEFPVAKYGKDWTMASPPEGYTTHHNGFRCLLKEESDCFKWKSSKGLMRNHLAAYHSLQMGDPPRGRPPKEGAKPRKKASAGSASAVSAKDRNNGDFGYKIWKAKRVKTTSLFLHAASDRRTPIETIHQDYQAMYYRWRHSSKFQKTLKNTWVNIREYWTKRMDEQHEGKNLTWKYIRRKVSDCVYAIDIFVFMLSTLLCFLDRYCLCWCLCFCV